MTNLEIADLLTRCREFIDTTTVPAYPAGADIADAIDIALSALAAPAPQPEHGQLIHYPDCWDTAAYPTLDSAVSEVLAWAGCSACKDAKPQHAGLQVLVNAGALQMVRNALKRDAEAGNVARCEMLAELDKATAEYSSVK